MTAMNSAADVVITFGTDFTRARADLAAFVAQAKQPITLGLGGGAGAGGPPGSPNYVGPTGGAASPVAGGQVAQGVAGLTGAATALTNAAQALNNAAANLGRAAGGGGLPLPGGGGGGPGGFGGTFAAWNPATGQAVPLAFNPGTGQFFNTQNGMGIAGVGWPGAGAAGPKPPPRPKGGGFLGMPNGMAMYMNVMFGGMEIHGAMRAAEEGTLGSMYAETSLDALRASMAGVESVAGGMHGALGGIGLDALGIGPSPIRRALRGEEFRTKAMDRGAALMRESRAERAMIDAGPGTYRRSLAQIESRRRGAVEDQYTVIGEETKMLGAAYDESLGAKWDRFRFFGPNQRIEDSQGYNDYANAQAQRRQTIKAARDRVTSINATAANDVAMVERESAYQREDMLDQAADVAATHQRGDPTANRNRATKTRLARQVSRMFMDDDPAAGAFQVLARAQMAQANFMAAEERFERNTSYGQAAGGLRGLLADRPLAVQRSRFEAQGARVARLYEQGRPEAEFEDDLNRLQWRRDQQVDERGLRLRNFGIAGDVLRSATMTGPGSYADRGRRATLDGIVRGAQGAALADAYSNGGRSGDLLYAQGRGQLGEFRQQYMNSFGAAEANLGQIATSGPGSEDPQKVFDKMAESLEHLKKVPTTQDLERIVNDAIQKATQAN